jgi:hypothetical protein
MSEEKVAEEKKETTQLKPEDQIKAKKKGKLFGDPILVIE